MRLFFGLQLPAHWRQALANQAAALKKAGVKGTFTRPENYHLTLVFLGETQRVEEAKRALRQVKGAPFPLRSAAPGCFSKKGGDIWWLGVEPSPALMDLQHSLETHLRAAGFPLEERPYRPHITLARRVKGPSELLGKVDLPPQEALIHQLTLFSSERVDGVLRYLPLCHQSLM